jgi:hypothetical protein
MNRKRSKGVTFWGWTLIIFGVIGILGARVPQPAIKLQGVALSYIDILLQVASVVTGVFILRLNETARKAVVILGVLSIMRTSFLFVPLIKESPPVIQAQYVKARQNIIEKMKPEYQEKALDDLDKTNESSKKLWPIFMVFIGVFMFMLKLLPIIFFTRPKVKEQFS